MAMGNKFVLIFLSLLALGLFGEGEARAADPVDSNVQAASTDHGDLQVFELVSDRPQLQVVVQKDGPIWNWLRDGFNYSEDGVKIFWDSGPTKKTNTTADSETRTDQSTKWCFIRADLLYKGGPYVGTEIKAEELLYDIVLELNNAKQRNEAAKIWRQAYNGKLTRKEYILDNAKLEFRSGKGVKSFYEEVWVPYCKEHQIEPDHRLWALCQPVFYQTWIKQFPPGSTYPWRLYGDQYDDIVKKREGRW
jgi:hypothetical protein